MNDKAEKVALILLEIGIVSFDTGKGFEWQSGITAPIYCDHRKLLFFPKARNKITDIFVDAIKQIWPQVEIIAGVETGGISWSALIADKMDLPLIYIRKKRKEHGKQKRIEGLPPKKGQNIGVIEDVVSTGGSLGSTIAVVKKSGANAKGFSIFTYGLEESKERFKEEKIEVFSLTNLNALLKVAVKNGFLKENEVKIIEQWRNDLNDNSLNFSLG